MQTLTKSMPMLYEHSLWVRIKKYPVFCERNIPEIQNGLDENKMLLNKILMDNDSQTCNIFFKIQADRGQSNFLYFWPVA